MRKIELLGIGVLFGAIPITVGFLAGWWMSIPLVPESQIFQYALVGFLIGILIDLFFLRRWIRAAYSEKPFLWMALYLFYSICVFGFFMGVPVFNILLVFPAGFFIGGWLVHRNANAFFIKKVTRLAAMSTTSILALICIASASLAVRSPSTASDLEGMLGLPFQVTQPMIMGLILGGGILILTLNWWLTRKSIEIAYQYLIALGKKEHTTVTESPSSLH
jgi:hypothetical protein